MRVAGQANRISKIVLMAAALIAGAGIGTAVWRSRQESPAPPAAAAVPPPSAEAAVSQLEARLKATPNDAAGWASLGGAFFDAQRFAESATAYRRATQLAPGNGEYWSSLGEALSLAGSGTITPDARAAFAAALKRDAADPRARYYLAVGKDMDGDHSGAIEDWFALLKLSPADAPWTADVRKAIVDVAAKNRIDVTERLAAVKPAAPRASIATAAIPGPTPEAMRAASAMPKGAQDAMVTQMVEGLAAKLAANPRNVDGWMMLMRSRMTLGQTQQARTALQAALAANPRDTVRLNQAAGELGIPTE